MPGVIDHPLGSTPGIETVGNRAVMGTMSRELPHVAIRRDEHLMRLPQRLGAAGFVLFAVAGLTVATAPAASAAQLPNGGFEDSALTGWTMETSRVDLGVTSLAGCQTVDTQDYTQATHAVPNEDDSAPVAATYRAQVDPTEKTEGAQSVRLVSLGMTTNAGYDVVHGPAAVSSKFAAKAHQLITFDWRAIGGADDYAVLGYLLDSNSCTQTEILDSIGTSTNWAPAQVEIPANSSDYQFVFVAGTFDKTGGRAAGASLYIDNIQTGFTDTTTIPDIPETGVGDPQVLPATTDNGVPVVYTSETPTICTVTGNTVSTLGAGSCRIVARSLGNDDYLSSTVTKSFTVARLEDEVSVFPIADLRPGATHDLPANSDGGVPIVYTSSTDSVCTVAGNTVTTVSVGTCNIVGSTTGTAKYQIAKVLLTAEVNDRPSAPSNVTGTGFKGEAVIAWDASAADNGAPITQYRVVASPGGKSCAVTPPFTVLQCNVKGLKGPQEYTFAVYAVNGVGVSDQSVASGLVKVASGRPSKADLPWAVREAGAKIPSPAKVRVALPVLSDDEVEAHGRLVSLTPELCVVRDSRVFTLAPGKCRISRTTDQGRSILTVRIKKKGGRNGLGQAKVVKAGSLYFGPDKATLDSSQARIAKAMGKLLRGSQVMVIGHAYNGGTGNDDLPLSASRAANAAKILRKYSPGTMSLVSGIGSTAPSGTAQSDRRVDVMILK